MLNDSAEDTDDGDSSFGMSEASGVSAVSVAADIVGSAFSSNSAAAAAGVVSSTASSDVVSSPTLDLPIDVGIASVDDSASTAASVAPPSGASSIVANDAASTLGAGGSL